MKIIHGHLFNKRFLSVIFLYLIDFNRFTLQISSVTAQYWKLFIQVPDRIEQIAHDARTGVHCKGSAEVCIWKHKDSWEGGLNGIERKVTWGAQN